MKRPGIAESALLLLVRSGLGGIFGFAAWAKLSNPQSFADSIKAFKVLPDHLAILATFTIPWAEAVCAVLFILGLWTRAAALMLSLQLVIFITGILSVLIRHLDVSCGCFGKYDLLCHGPLGLCNVGQNALLLLGTLLILVRGPGSASTDRFLERSRP